MQDGESREVLKKTTTFINDANGNELRQGVSFISPHSIKARQTVKGSIQGDDIEGNVDTLIERVSNTFDGFNRLKKVENIKAGVRTVVEYTYNGDNLRIRKEVKKSSDSYKAEVTNYLYDRQHVILETGDADSIKVRYTRGINYIARIDSTNKLSFFLYNGHGDVVHTVSEEGEIENRYDYDIFGNPTLTIEYYTCAIRYAGEFYDAETGLYYLRSRYYNPYIGRFISEDSYWGEDTNPLSLNLYSYCSNDPVNFIDPSGHKREGDELIKDDYTNAMIKKATELYEQVLNDTKLTDKEKKAYYKSISEIADIARADYIIQNPNSAYATTMFGENWQQNLVVTENAVAVLTDNGKSSKRLNEHKSKVAIIMVQRLMESYTDKNNKAYLTMTNSTYGVFGKNTKEAVKNFQTDNGLTGSNKDGKVGKNTLEKMFSNDKKEYVDVRKGQVKRGYDQFMGSLGGIKNKLNPSKGTITGGKQREDAGGVVGEADKTDVPPIQGDFYQIVNGTPIKSYYRQLVINGEKRWVITPHDFEEYYYANAYQMSPGELVDWVVGMTPVDWAKDAADLVAGKNLFTGEEQSFWLSAACLIGPEAVDQLLKQGKKVVKNTAQAVTNKKVGTLFENYVEAKKLKNVDYDTQKLRHVYDEAGELKQVKPDFTVYDKNLNMVAVADAKTALSGVIPFDDQAKNLVRLAASETTTKTLIYYIPEGINPIITQDFMDFAIQKGVKIQFTVVK